MDNRVVIAGTVVRPGIRHSPSGVPIARFTLQHDSVRTEAGVPRRVACRIGVVAAGEIGRDASAMAQGATVRVSGFLSRAGYRDDGNRLVLHADHIERIPPEELPDGPDRPSNHRRD